MDDEPRDVTLEVATKGGQVGLIFSLPGEPEPAPFWLDPDEARDLVNSLGAAILYVTTGVRAR
jgi:hypothetical protein